MAIGLAAATTPPAPATNQGTFARAILNGTAGDLGIVAMVLEVTPPSVLYVQSGALVVESDFHASSPGGM